MKRVKVAQRAQDIVLRALESMGNGAYHKRDIHFAARRDVECRWRDVDTTDRALRQLCIDGKVARVSPGVYSVTKQWPA